MKTMILALALSAISGAALAESSATLTYGNLQVGGVNIDGLMAEVDGAYDSGFNYEVDLATGDIEGVAVKSGELTLGYTFNNIAGPVVVYSATELGGVSSDMVMAGVAGKYDIGALALGGELVSDVKNFGDTNRLTVDATYALTDRVNLLADIAYTNIDMGADSTVAQLGASYGVSDAMNLEANVLTGDVAGAHLKGVSLGLGFKF